MQRHVLVALAILALVQVAATTCDFLKGAGCSRADIERRVTDPAPTNEADQEHVNYATKSIGIRLSQITGETTINFDDLPGLYNRIEEGYKGLQWERWGHVIDSAFTKAEYGDNGFHSAGRGSKVAMGRPEWSASEEKWQFYPLVVSSASTWRFAAVSCRLAPAFKTDAKIYVRGFREGLEVASDLLTGLSWDKPVDYQFPRGFASVDVVTFDAVLGDIADLHGDSPQLGSAWGDGVFAVDDLVLSVDGYVPTVISDPHISTWDGAHVTYHLQGDFVLVQSESTGLAVHSRFCFPQNARGAPFVCQVAVRCSSAAETLEILPDNFESVAPTSAKHTAVKRDRHGALHIRCRSNFRVSAMLHAFSEMKGVRYFSLHFRGATVPSDARGLMGSRNGNSRDDLAFRDGRPFVLPRASRSLIGFKNSYPEVHALQESWRVPASEKLFTSAFVERHRTEALIHHSPMLADSASRSCRAAKVMHAPYLQMCVHDVMQLSSTEVAAHYADFLKHIGEI